MPLLRTPRIRCPKCGLELPRGSLSGYGTKRKLYLEHLDRCSGSKTIEHLRALSEKKRKPTA